MNPVTIATWRAAVSGDSGKTFAALVHEGVILEGLNHRPLDLVLKFSAALADRLRSAV